MTSEQSGGKTPIEDWTAFRSFVPWFVKEGDDVTVGSLSIQTERLSPTANRLFPKFFSLLRIADVTEVSVNGNGFLLYAWTGRSRRRMGWLAERVPDKLSSPLWEDHKLLLSCFGGIVEQFNAPPNWLSNHGCAITVSESLHDASFLEDYAWLFEDAGGEIPIAMDEYYSIAREANGNTTLCHRSTGRILLFAPDHSFQHISPLPGCPEYSLYEVNGATDFREWVEEIASQWIHHLATSF